MNNFTIIPERHKLFITLATTPYHCLTEASGELLAVGREEAILELLILVPCSPWHKGISSCHGDLDNKVYGGSGLAAILVRST